MLRRAHIAWILLLTAVVPIAVRAEAQWLVPDLPGMRPGVIRIDASEDATAVGSTQLRARGWWYLNWREQTPSQGALERVLAGNAQVDRSHLVLMAAGAKARAAVVLALQLEQAPATAVRLRGLVLRIDGEIEWPQLPVSAEWPALLLGYEAGDALSRQSAFALAGRARAAGAAVWLLPLAESADLANEALLPDWLATLEIVRARRFEDALVRAYAGPHSAALESALSERAQQLRAKRASAGSAGAQVFDLDGSVTELLVDAQARLLRRHGLSAELEFDANAALNAIYGDAGSLLDVDVAAAVPLLHPETGGEVLAIPAHRSAVSGAHSVLLLRHGDGNYGLLDLGDTRAVEALMASPDARDHGHAWWARMAEADARGSRLLRIELQPVHPRRGLWWDPSHPGHALDLQPVAGGHSAVFATYDAAGASRWYLASGRIERGQFATTIDGLQLMRRDPALSAPKADRAHAGSIRVDFSVDASHPVCRARQAAAAQLALLSVQHAGRAERWCIEPVALPAGVPDQDVNGVWYGGSGDSGWGLSVLRSGASGRGLISAMLYFHDDAGWPRWAMGAGANGIGGATLTMHDYSLACRDCADASPRAQALGELRLRIGGWCGAPELRASFELGGADAALAFQRQDMPLQRLSQSRCD
ncbi:MAG: hypothetical protein IT478_06380 [Xanthomonadales bacterium]|nr:hypothetical protein [Xanthomonadales bacterium]